MPRGPDFFVVGAQRAGTTRLCGLLDLHPGIRIPTKEPMFFQDRDAHWPAAQAEWYRQLFVDAPRTALLGDCSTHYSMCSRFPGTAERIFEFNPTAKIIYMVRDPIRRIESAWPELVSVYHANRFRGFDWTLRRSNLLLDPSMYWRQLSEYRRYFPDEQILIQFFEDFVENEEAVVSSCWAFLGLSRERIDAADARVLPRNESLGKVQRALVVDAVRALPAYERYKRLIPQPVKSYFSTRFTSAIDVDVKWKAETLAWAKTRLHPDSAAFLAHVGRNSSSWDI